MIGPPGLPKIGRRVFSFAGSPRAPSRDRLQPFKWAAGLYLAGVLAHFGHHMAFDLPAGIDPSFGGGAGQRSDEPGMAGRSDRDPDQSDLSAVSRGTSPR